MNVTLALEPDFFNHIHCTGDESRLTDCTIIPIPNINRNLCDKNKVAEVVCDIGMITVIYLLSVYTSHIHV